MGAHENLCLLQTDFFSRLVFVSCLYRHVFHAGHVNVKLLCTKVTLVSPGLFSVTVVVDCFVVSHPFFVTYSS